MMPFILNLIISIISCAAIIFRFQDIVLRTGLIISVVCASLISFGLITLYAGKPIVKSLPNDIIVYGHAINLEDKRIYIMYKKTNGDWPPTLIDMKYSKELKEALKSGVKIHKGKPFRMKESEEGTQGGEGEGKEGHDHFPLHSDPERGKDHWKGSSHLALGIDGTLSSHRRICRHRFGFRRQDP